MARTKGKTHQDDTGLDGQCWFCKKPIRYLIDDEGTGFWAICMAGEIRVCRECMKTVPPEGFVVYQPRGRGRKRIPWRLIPGELPLRDDCEKVKRNRTREQIQTAQNRASTIVELRRQREDGEWDELLQVAQALIVCGLPYQRTKERQLVRRAPAADGSEVVVTFTATDPDVELPYGSDRTLLHWLVDRAIRADQPFVAWETATEFLRDAGLSDAGPNYRDLRDRFERLSSVAITVIREHGGRKRRLIMPIIEESNLPSSVDLRAEVRGERRILDEVFGFKLSARFWTEVKDRHVPVPWELIRKTRKQSQLQDFMLWIYWRSYAAKGPSRVPLDALREQFMIEDSNPRRLKQHVKDAYQALRFIDPSFPGKVDGDFIHVIPYRGFLPGGEDLKTLK